VNDTKPTWWVLEGTALREMLNRAHAGEDPELLFLELYANSEQEDVDG
jgi:hypothetical protein